MRDLLLIAGISVVAIGIGGILFFFGPHSLQSDMTNTLASDQAASPTVPFTVLEKGSDALSISSRTNYRITTDSDFRALWSMIYGSRTTPAVPTIDFSKYEVLGIFDGSHTTNAYDVSVASIKDSTESRIVVITHKVQDSSCTPAPGASSPYELLEVPKTTVSLSHTDATSTVSCAGN